MWLLLSTRLGWGLTILLLCCPSGPAGCFLGSNPDTTCWHCGQGGSQTLQLQAPVLWTGPLGRDWEATLRSAAPKALHISVASNIHFAHKLGTWQGQLVSAAAGRRGGGRIQAKALHLHVGHEVQGWGLQVPLCDLDLLTA